MRPSETDPSMWGRAGCSYRKWRDSIPLYSLCQTETGPISCQLLPWGRLSFYRTGKVDLYICKHSSLCITLKSFVSTLLRWFPYLWRDLQNKSKRPETKSAGGAEGVKENVLTPDTGQSPAADCPEEPRAAAAAAASSSSPTGNNNNNNSNYNLVTSLLNLTKSPVSEPHART